MIFFFSSRRRHTRYIGDWSSDVCSSDLLPPATPAPPLLHNHARYDSAGNLISIPGVAAYTFNAENQLVSAGGLTYGYDGDGKRVTNAPSSAPAQPIKIYSYGAGSTPVIETDGAGNFQYRYIFFNGMRVSREEDNESVDHYGLDALGNVRLVYGNNGSLDVSDYYPVGGKAVL